MVSLPNAPQLLFRQAYGHETHPSWELSLFNVRDYDTGEDVTITLKIRFSYGNEDGNPNRYKLVTWEYGEEITLVSPEEWEQRYQDVLDNESQEAADAWVAQNRVRVGALHHLALGEALKARWEAMLTLNLFTPHVTG